MAQDESYCNNAYSYLFKKPLKLLSGFFVLALRTTSMRTCFVSGVKMIEWAHV
jgi:hypothetical protein